MKGAGFFSHFPKDLARLIYFRYLDDCTAFMLCYAVRKRSINNYKWLYYAINNNYDNVIRWADMMGYQTITYDILREAAKTGSIVKYFTKLSYFDEAMIMNIGVGGVPENIDHILEWAMTNRVGNTLIETLLLRGALLSSNTSSVRYLLKRFTYINIPAVSVMKHNNVALAMELIQNKQVSFAGKQFAVTDTSISTEMLDFAFSNGAFNMPVYGFEFSYLDIKRATWYCERFPDQIPDPYEVFRREKYELAFLVAKYKPLVFSAARISTMPEPCFKYLVQIMQHWSLAAAQRCVKHSLDYLLKPLPGSDLDDFAECSPTCEMLQKLFPDKRKSAIMAFLRTKKTKRV
jgi:hypothetical protein